MGYLNETVQRIDRVLTCTGAGSIQRDYVRTGFYLGVKALLDVAERTDGMSPLEVASLFDGCRDDFFAFQWETVDSFLAKVKKRTSSV